MVFFFALCADFLRRSRRLHPHPHPQSDGMHGALQGLLLRGEGAAHHDGGLLPGRLPQQHPPQLLPGPAAGADLHQRGPGVLRQHLLQRGARCLDLCCFCLVLFSFFFFVLTAFVSLPMTTPPAMRRWRASEEEPGGDPAVSATTK